MPNGWSRYRIGRSWFHRYRRQCTLTNGDTITVEKVVSPYELSHAKLARKWVMMYVAFECDVYLLAESEKRYARLAARK